MTTERKQSETANGYNGRTDVFFSDVYGEYKYEGFTDKAFRYIEDFQLLDAELWRRFVQQFREDADYEAGWRGEYWGKMMRGASLVYQYTKNPELYDILKETIKDMINSADETGRATDINLKASCHVETVALLAVSTTKFA